jgi:hypothetical protein
MRWQRLFDDLEAQIEAGSAAELEAEVADRTRSEFARLRLIDRLRGSLGAEIDVELPMGMRERGVLERVGADWMLLHVGGTLPAQEVLVPVVAVQVVRGLRPSSAAPGSAGPVESALSFGFALRRVARDRSRVRITFRDGTACSGVLMRVGADFVEVADEVRPSAATALVASTSVTAVRRLGEARLD